MRHHTTERQNGHHQKVEGRHIDEAQLDSQLRQGGDDRGRTADKPSQIPARGYKDIALRIKNKITEHNLTMIAGGIAYFAILGMFPALIAMVSIYGLVFSPAEVEQQIQSVSALLPGDARRVLSEQLNTLTSRPASTLGWGLVLGVGGALFSASAAVEKVMDAIGIAYDQPNRRGMIKQRGLALLLTLSFIVAGLVALAMVAIVPAVLNFVQLGAVGEALVRYGRWPALGAMVMVGLAVLYAVAPHRDRPKWRWVSWGAITATLLWVVASLGLSVYVSNFSSYGETYGAIGGVIVLMLWLYISAFMVLLGAEVNAEMEAQTAKDSTVGPPKPMGHRGAVKADELGEAHDGRAASAKREERPTHH